VNTGPLSLNDRLQMAVIGRLKFDFQWANHWHYSNPNSSEWNGMGAVNHCAWAVAALTVGYVYLSICPGQALGCPEPPFPILLACDPWQTIGMSRHFAQMPKVQGGQGVLQQCGGAVG